MTQKPAYDVKKLKSTGLMKQKTGDLFSVRLKLVGGHITSEQLRGLAEAADGHGVGHVHLTTRQGVEIPGVEYGQIESLEQALEAVGLQFGACGPRVRTITACQGSLCTFGLVDTQALAHTVDERVCEVEGLPHKFKIAITGCPNGCIKPQENDFGIMGQSFIARDASACVDCGLCADACRRGAFEMKVQGLVEDLSLCSNCGRCVALCPTDALRSTASGYAAFVGGKMGNEPRLADRLPFSITDESVLLDVLGATLDWYAANGAKKERFGATIDRIGLSELTDHIEGQVQEVVS